MLNLPTCLRAIAHRFALAALVMLAPLLPTWAAPSPVGAAAKDTVRRLPLFEYNGRPALRITPAVASERTVFGPRLDEEVVKATVLIRYAYSPMLIPGQSHLRVLLNDDVIAVLPVTREDVGRQMTREITLPAAAIGGVNRIKLDLVGHYATACESPIHAGMWLDILEGSEVRMLTRPVEPRKDLGLLPMPFFDPQDFNRLELPVLLPPRPSSGTLQAAAIVASWFGKLAAWRGARFPVMFRGEPSRHGVVFATNDERPPLLRALGTFTGPSLSVIDNPAPGGGKLLLIAGRNARDLLSAAGTLATASAALSGQAVAVQELRPGSPRQAYDAPNWVRLDRPMKFGELVQSRQQLQVSGHLTPSVNIELRIPPGLFLWQSRGVPVDLKLRYSPPISARRATLHMAVNGEPLQQLGLRASGTAADPAHVLVPLLDQASEQRVRALRLGTRNTLEFAFSFPYPDGSACGGDLIGDVHAMIDPDSTIDLTGYPQYALMPNLGYFASSGFPFTKFADLSETVVVLPAEPGANDIAVMLGLLARMAQSTGYPATGVTVARAGDGVALRDRDLLVIGTSARQPLLRTWQQEMPAVIDGPGRGIRHPAGRLDQVLRWVGRSRPMPPDPTPQRHVRGNGPLAALIGLESPVTSGRSVVVATAAEDENFPQLLDALDDERLAASLFGSVVLIHGGVTESLFAGDTYTLGSLPFWTALWYPLSAHPILLVAMAVIAALVFTVALWRSLRSAAARRLADRALPSGETVPARRIPNPDKR
jgi:cellulose synthase operon protein B